MICKCGWRVYPFYPYPMDSLHVYRLFQDVRCKVYIELPDEDDRHVVAAAMKGQAESIITFNLKDFPLSKLESLGLSAIHPDEFLCDMFELNASACVKAAQQQRRSLKNPSMTAEEFLACLQKQKLPSFVSNLKSFQIIL